MEEHQLGGHRDVGRVSPVIDVATKSLGCFRAIAIIALWVRATDLQEQGKFFELNDLFRMISQLEPRFPSIWSYWAWNVAYNCSVKFPAVQPEERWRWVKLGIEILRDRGIVENPKAPTLYRELGWIYDHKINGDLDDAHIYYKVRVATEMQEALGLPPYLERLKAIAAAPEAERDLLADPAVRKLAKALQDAGVDAFGGRLDVANRSPQLPPPALAALDDKAHAQAAERLDAFLRAQHLKRELKLDAHRMVKLMAKYGPIDWRLPSAQAHYWYALCVEIFGFDVIDAANADRLAFHTLAQQYHGGHVRFDPPTDTAPARWSTAPNFDFLEPVLKLHEEIAKKHEKGEWGIPTRDAYLNFLRQVIVDLYTNRDFARAQRYLTKLLDLGGEEQTTLEEFVYQRFNKLLENMTVGQCLNLIRNYLFQSLVWTVYGDTDRAVGAENMARFLYNRYKERNLSDRIKDLIPALRELWLDALAEALRRFRPAQADELRRLYPKDSKEIEDQLKRMEEEAAKKQRQPPPPAPKR